jgi:hypothetical protein
MRPTAFLLLVCSAISSGCGRDSAPPTAPPAAPPPGASNLIHSPPIKQLTDEQLRSLSMRCEKYVPEKSARGPYDAAYCEDAIAAWSDAPLQMIPMRKDSVPQSTDAPK